MIWATATGCRACSRRGMALAATGAVSERRLGPRAVGGVVPIGFYALGSIVCVVQALVFAILAISYVRMAATTHY